MSLTWGIYAGLLMGHYATASRYNLGKRKSKNAGSVKCLKSFFNRLKIQRPTRPLSRLSALLIKPQNYGLLAIIHALTELDLTLHVVVGRNVTRVVITYRIVKK